jgi:hypothetical protein
MDAGLDTGIDARLDGDTDATTTGDTVQIKNSVRKIPNNTPLVGARVCIVDRPEIACVTTDANGAYTLTMPAWTAPADIAFNVTAAGYLGFTGLVHETPGSVTWLSAELYDDTGATQYLTTRAGFTYPAAGKAFVQVAVFRQSGGAAQGLTVTISPPGVGPVYLDKNGIPDPTLTAITTDGYLLFANLTPGPVEITFSDPACTPAPVATDGWVSSKPNAVAGKTAPDSMTNIVAICPF